MKQTSINVFGQTYLEAVQLEKSGKGPRLFCDDSVVNAISNKSIIKEVDKNKGVYEIVWTMEGCETTERSSEKWNNVLKRINDLMLPAAVNLYNYYKAEEKLKPQYRGLLDIVCCGIIKYANDECHRADDAINYINEYLVKYGIDIRIGKDIIENFLT